MCALMTLPLFSACAGTPAKKKAVTVTGIVRIVGNEPFTELVVTDKAGVDWFVSKEQRKLLQERQNQEVTVRGTPIVTEQRLANGKALPPRHDLRDVAVIK
jgi:hypothetical protein